MFNGLRNQLSNTIKTISAPFTPPQAPEIVTIDYSDLMEKDSSELFDKIERAFSDKGLGILLVRGAPDFQAKREQILKNTFKLAQLSQEKLAELEAPEFDFGIGWSHGRE